MKSLNAIATKLAHADALVKDAEKMRESLRTAFFKEATNQITETRVLKRRPLVIPKEFFHRTKLTFEDFVSSRYPTWKLVEHEADDKAQTFTLLIEEDPEYQPFEFISDQKQIVSRQVAQSSPEIDTATLKAEAPELWEMIMKPKIVYELDTEALERAVVDDPSVVALMQRHYRYPRKPSKKLGPIRIAKEEE